MRYGGNVTIIDDEGNVMFERELNEDEIVEALLAAIPDGSESEPQEPPDEDEPARTPKPPVDGLRACCGAQTRGRHKKGCPEGKPTPISKNRRTVDGRKPFTEPTYNVVKTMLDDGYGSPEEISDKKGLDLDEVRRVNLSNDFDDYLAIA